MPFGTYIDGEEIQAPVMRGDKVFVPMYRREKNGVAANVHPLTKLANLLSQHNGTYSYRYHSKIYIIVLKFNFCTKIFIFIFILQYYLKLYVYYFNQQYNLLLTNMFLYFTGFYVWHWSIRG